MKGGDLKQTLREGGSVFGMMLTMARNPRWGNILAGGGIDYVVIDTEHSQRSRAEISDSIVWLKAAGLTVIVRIPFPVPHYVTMALDAGADGVLVPYCESVEEVRDCVGAKEWHPLKGQYLKRAIERGEHASDKTRDYLAARHADNIIIIGIESEPAYLNLDAILGVGGIDAIFVGPNDMSTSLGIPDEYDNPRYWDVLAEIARKSEAAGAAVMIHQQNVADSTIAIELGARFVLHSSEGRTLQRQMQSDFNALREAAGSLERAVEDTVETV